MKQYDSYKDSGVEWIGEVPSHWEVVPLKRAITINNGCDYKHVQVEEDGYPVIGSGGQFAWANQYMYDGEAVLLGRKGTIDKPMYYNGKFWTVDTMFYGIPKKNANCKYLYYQAKNIPFERYATATALPSMTQTDLNNNTICLPPLDEQIVIANYLDKKCSEIDNVISAQQKRIALLQELKQSVITHAVTKGLNPNVEMKDSGMEWIGEVPKHWEIKKLKYITFLQSGDTIKPSDFKDEGEYPVYGGNGFRGYTDKYTNEGLHVLIGRQGALCGNINYANGRFYASEHAIVSYPLHGENVVWLGETMRTCDFNRYSQTAAQPGIAVNVIKNIAFPYPSIKEQNDIANYLTKRCASIDNVLSKAQHQVELLQEYKQSLITEVVTGKRKVS